MGRGGATIIEAIDYASLRSLSRSCGGGRGGVPDKKQMPCGETFPHPPRSCERVDLPRKRER
jgi:hypothetical protein